MTREWLRELLVNSIISNLSGMFGTVNIKMGEIVGKVGMTSSVWNGGTFPMIQDLSETVTLPIAGIILTFITRYELMQIVIEKNNLHDINTWIFFKQTFEAMCAVPLVVNTWDIVMGIFGLTQHVVNQSTGVIIFDAGIDITGTVVDLETRFAGWSIGSLLGLWPQSISVGLTMNTLFIYIFLMIYGCMIEVYLVILIRPIPLTTMVSRKWGGMGQNYSESLLASGFQALLIMVCVGIHAVLVQIIVVDDDTTGTIWACTGCTVFLCYTLFRTSNLAKSLLATY